MRRAATSLCTCAALAALAGPAGAEPQAVPHRPHAVVTASRALSPPRIDGRLNDEAWATAVPASTFTQRDPDEGEPASERTEIRVLYDDAALYVGARLWDDDAAAISRRLSRRDGSDDADRLTIYLDPLHDHLTGASFRVDAAGVQQDQVLYNDTWSDSTWDAVWQSDVSIDADGWSAEIRIPLSQLRFPAGDHLEWGFNVERFIWRKNESDWLEFVPKSENGLVSRMAHLDGLNSLNPRRHVELLPYAAGRAEFIEPALGDPFNDGSRGFGTGGLDFKWGLTSNLTLDGTVNPDFGQVEVDPAVVNLTQFETFFAEKRPFFLEGSQIFNNFGQIGANNYWGFNTSDPQIFYSRRIGRAPQLATDADFVDVPAATTILGAGKVTGKTTSGWSIGLLNAVAGQETARVATGGALGRVVVEPRTNYFVTRVQHDLNARTGIGFLATAVNRSLDSPQLRDALPGQAYVVGGDGYRFLSDARDWVVNGKIAFSRVAGSDTVIERLERAPQRYFQRPDALHVTLDPTRRSLAGFAGRVNVNKNSGLRQWNMALWGVSPGFESNDLGFFGTGDRAGGHVVYFTRNVAPGRIFRSRSWWAAKWWTWNFARQLQGDGIQGNAFFTFLNYWSVGTNLSWRRETQDDRLTRGGPSAAQPASHSWNINASTDRRRVLSLEFFTNRNATAAGGWNRNAGVTVNLRPTPTLAISLGPQFSRSHTVAQYIRTVEDDTATATYGERDVFGALEQMQLSMTTRVNVVVSPRVSLQVFAQPLLAAGDYSNFKELAAPRTYDFFEYGTAGSSVLYDVDSSTYTVDPDGEGPAPSFTFGNPDFNFKSLRVNAVFRWELKPGSAFYAVWTREQRDGSNPGDFDVARDLGALLHAPGNDVVLFKFAYWIGR
jgi:hypothetical protein